MMIAFRCALYVGGGADGRLQLDVTDPEVIEAAQRIQGAMQSMLYRQTQDDIDRVASPDEPDAPDQERGETFAHSGEDEDDTGDHNEDRKEEDEEDEEEEEEQ